MREVSGSMSTPRNRAGSFIYDFLESRIMKEAGRVVSFVCSKDLEKHLTVMKKDLEKKGHKVTVSRLVAFLLYKGLGVPDPKAVAAAEEFNRG